MAYTTINKSTDYFNTKLYTGTGSTQSITGVGFAPDMVWSKNRSTTFNHQINDAVRGVNKQIAPNLTNAQETNTGELTAFGSDGFTVGSGGTLNGNGNNIVSWNWKANGTGSANTDGDITSTVSVNTTSGFSIVKYTGNATSGATIGHGLGVTPSAVFYKSLSTGNWFVYHKTIPATQHIVLNSSNAVATSSTIFNDTAPTSSLLTIGNYSEINGSGNSHIAYCFAPKRGFSSMNSYIGNGSSSNPPFIYTGFKVGWVLIKNISATDSWFLHDHLRDGFNEDNEYLRPNENSAEGSGVNRCNLYSNGFTVPTTDKSHNTNGSTYIYIAFAEAPLVGSNNVPACAR